MRMRFVVILALALAVTCWAQTKLVPEEFIVKPGTVRYWTFEVTNEARVVAGRFHAQGGTGNDIQVIVAEWDECENWMNGHAAKSYYGTGHVTNGKIAVKLPQSSGKYCIAFSNRMSSVATKEISAQIFLVSE